ncbi:MAG: hypothetical protein ACR2QG_09675 [Gammaproteobacteria bacterium]
MTGTSNQSATLMQVTSLREYFRDSISDAMASNSLHADSNTTHYVVNLLTLFARSESFHDPVDDSQKAKPLALMLSDALEAPTTEQRCYGLQRLGDVALFVAGFFADDLQSSVVDLDYYVSMGGGAYVSLSHQSGGTIRGRVTGAIFAELGEKFQQFVDVLNDVSYQTDAASDSDVLRQYEIWLKTGSERAARLLREQGIHPMTSLRATPEQ